MMSAHSDLMTLLVYLIRFFRPSEAGDIVGISLCMQVRSIGDAQEIKKVFGSIEYRLNTRVLGSGCITKKIKGDSMERMERNECHNPEIGTYNHNRRLFWVLEPYVGLLLQMKTGSLACNAIRIRHAEYSGAMV